MIEDEPGLSFVGLKFLYSFSSAQIHGVGRDAGRIAGQIAARRAARPALHAEGRPVAVDGR